MANIERIKQLYQFLVELPPKNFQWSSIRIPVPEKPIEECGTAACVAGWTYYLWPDEITLNVYNLDNRLVQTLGVTKEEASFVCFGDAWKDFPSLTNLDIPNQRELALERLQALINHYESNIS